MREQIYADLPQELREADELLTAYGLWAQDRNRPHTCGSAERKYKPEEPQEAPEEPPNPVVLSPEMVAAIGRSLYAVPERERRVLVAMYVPQRQNVMAWLRINRIPARMSREMHLAGVRMFWNVYKRVSAKEYA